MLNAPLRIMIVAALCAVGLIGLVVREGYERSGRNAGSRDIEMQMQAVDPRALLSGHYVIVSLQTTLPAFTEGAPCSTFAALGDEGSWVALAHIGPEHVVQPPADTPLRYVPVGVAATRDAAQAIARRINGDRPLAVRGTAFCSELTEEPGAHAPHRCKPSSAASNAFMRRKRKPNASTRSCASNPLTIRQRCSPSLTSAATAARG